MAVCLISVSGCLAYQDGNLPRCNGAMALGGTVRKPDCRIRCALSGENQYVMDGCKEGAVLEMMKESMFSAAEESGLFGSCRVHDQDASSSDGILLDVKCAHAPETMWDAPLVVFTLGIYPARQEGCRFLFTIDVCDDTGRQRQYRFQETLKSRLGVLTLLAMPFAGDASFQGVYGDMNRKVMNHLFVRMQKDGFFSAEGRDKAAAAKADVVEAAKKTVAARRKELEDLKKAEIINEVEFAAEVKKLEGAGK